MGSLEFLLVVMVCSNIDGDCQWQRVGRFKSEEICVANGLAIDPVVIRFKCVGVGYEPEHIPLPRARPQAKGRS
jgi:hypothetical protein